MGALGVGRSYFDRHAFQPQTTAGFLKDLRANLIKGDKALEAKLELDRWAYQAGLPDNAVHVTSATLAAVDGSASDRRILDRAINAFRKEQWGANQS